MNIHRSQSKGAVPPGVRFFVVFDSVVYGFLPVISSTILYIQGFLVNLSALFFIYVLATAIIVNAVLSWKGNKTGWMILLSLVTAYISITMLQSIFFIVNASSAEPEITAKLPVIVFRGCIVIFLHWWYYRTTTAKQFFNS